MGQAAVFTGSTSTAAPRATSGLHGFSAVATEPRGGLSPYLDERVQYRTPPPRARTPRQERTETMLHDASSSPSSPCPSYSSTSVSLDDVESGGGETCCKNGDKNTKCYIIAGDC